MNKDQYDKLEKEVNEKLLKLTKSDYCNSKEGIQKARDIIDDLIKIMKDISYPNNYRAGIKIFEAIKLKYIIILQARSTSLFTHILGNKKLIEEEFDCNKIISDTSTIVKAYLLVHLKNYIKNESTEVP